MLNNVMLNAKTLSVIIMMLIVAEVVVVEGGIQGVSMLYKRRLPYKLMTTTTTVQPDVVYIQLHNIEGLRGIF